MPADHDPAVSGASAAGAFLGLSPIPAGFLVAVILDKDECERVFLLQLSL